MDTYSIKPEVFFFSKHDIPTTVKMTQREVLKQYINKKLLPLFEKLTKKQVTLKKYEQNSHTSTHHQKDRHIHLAIFCGVFQNDIVKRSSFIFGSC